MLVVMLAVYTLPMQPERALHLPDSDAIYQLKISMIMHKRRSENVRAGLHTGP